MNTQIIKELKKEEASSIVDESLVSTESGPSEKEMREKKAMEEVFKIPLVLQEIIEGVEDLNDLKQCRLINSMWNETTTKVMLNKNSACVALRLDSRTKKYKKFIHWARTHYYRPSCYLVPAEQDIEGAEQDIEGAEQDIEDADHLTVLKEIVDKSTRFPCSTFMIYRGDLSDPKMEDFFKVVGDSIKELKLLSINGKSLKFGVLLGLNCSNLETLYTEIGDIDWSPGHISFELPKLKMLHMPHISCNCENENENEYFFKILTTLNAPNLQVIKGFELLEDLAAVVEVGKIHCVKELTFQEVGGLNCLTYLEKFVHVGLQLETLRLGFDYMFDSLDYDEKSKWMKLVQKLLDMSKNTLKSFRFNGIENVFENLNFPQFPQLREIQIDSSSTAEEGEEGVRYPYEILSDDISPNLQVIEGFDLFRDTEKIIRAGKIHCVKKLRVDDKILELEHLRLFLSGRPQLESLELCKLDSLDCRIQLERMNLDWTELTGHLEQLLELSKDTLTSLQFRGVGAFLKDIKFPKFSKLQHLQVAVQFRRIFPRGINLTETFPKLEVLDLHLCANFDEKWDEFFPPPDAYKGSLTSVKILIYCEWFTDAAKRNLRTLCPNAKVYYMNDFRGMNIPVILD